jgi:hypothetical protein
MISCLLKQKFAISRPNRWFFFLAVQATQQHNFSPAAKKRKKEKTNIKTKGNSR